jgi:ribosomal protein S18 acetylase RimI-like enzyme
MITYLESLDGVTPGQLEGGFFVGWPNPPSPATHHRILANSDKIVLALDDHQNVVGFITAISDDISCAYIPHLEVLPAHQGQGIGSQLVGRMLARLQHLYMIDLVCDPDLQPFYARLGLRPCAAMVIRNFDRQSCEPVP